MLQSMYIHCCCCHYPPGVVINFELPQYTAMESEGEVTVCARIAEGTLERDIVVQFTTENSTALGENGREGPNNHTCITQATPLTTPLTTPQDLQVTNSVIQMTWTILLCL